MSPQDTLNALLRKPRIRPCSEIETLPGLYLLYDHTETPRYIGETGNLQKRVYLNHCSGDENSHKWVCHYNHGRLWHSRKSPATDAVDGAVAKALRAKLARRFCSARVLPLPGLTDKGARKALEKAVRAIAPDPMNDWNDQKLIPTCAPDELIDQLLDELGWDAVQRASLDAQQARWLKKNSVSHHV
ncbi:hypothetical protein [Roseovarius sp.]|uniref:hypothetical protein n=1 Tax=Roseovarius sp. TaxID=1486281 RepID=UPI003A97A025